MLSQHELRVYKNKIGFIFMAHSVFYRATHVHRIASTVIEINVRHTGGPTNINTGV